MKLIYLLISVILISCNQSAPHKSHYVNVPQLPLPYQGFSNVDLIPIDTVEVQNNLKVIGKVFETSSFKGILLVNTYADYQLPYIFTFDLQGNTIDSLELFKINCSEDEFYWGAANYKIMDDLTIYLYDSTASYKRDGNGDIIKESIKSEVHHYKYIISNNGNILSGT